MIKLTLGYSNEILPYPAIEYIPLDINTKNLELSWSNRYSTKLYILDNMQDTSSTLSFFNIPIPTNINFKNNLLLLLLNAEVKDIYYRGYKVQMIGQLINNGYHLFAITKRYFYKDKLLFNFYLPTAEKIVSKGYQL